MVLYKSIEQCVASIKLPLHLITKIMSVWTAKTIIWGILILWSSNSSSCLSGRKCEFEGIFNFGDSLSDTGGYFAAFPSLSEPYGITYFKSPAGRASNGRLIIDFLAGAMGFPYLSPYLQSIGSDYRHGANFASWSATVLSPDASLLAAGISPFSLAVQLNQFKEFKHRVLEFHSSNFKEKDNMNGNSNNEGFCSSPRNDYIENSKSDHISWNLNTFLVEHLQIGSTKLPPSNIFKKSLYIIHIGHNDFTISIPTAFTHISTTMDIEGVKQYYFPQVVGKIASTIKELYELGGRAFLVLNLAPLGCSPLYIIGVPHNSSDVDNFGCVTSYNNAIVDYNHMLKEALDNTKKELPFASLIYVNIYSILLDLIQHPTSHGLKYGTRVCCGYGGGAFNYDVNFYCGTKKSINGSIISVTACNDPYNYVSWDGIHLTEVAHKILAMSIFNDSYLDPPFAPLMNCNIHVVD